MVPYTKHPEQMAEERFFEQVKNLITGDYFQLETIPRISIIAYRCKLAVIYQIMTRLHPSIQGCNNGVLTILRVIFLHNEPI